MGTSDEAMAADGGSEPVSDAERNQARKRLEARREFTSHAGAYVACNIFMIGIWAFTGAGYFWPGWVLGGWGVALGFHAVDTFGRRPISDADVDAEARRRRHRG